MRWAALVAAGLWLAGCGSSGHTATSPAASTAPPASAVGAPDLAPQLLSLSDMPPGWSAGDVGSTPACITKVTSLSSGAEEHAVSSFRQDGPIGLPAVAEDLNYAPGSAAQSELAAVSSALGTCRQIRFTASGLKFTGTVGPLSLPTVGDASAAFQSVLTSTTLPPFAIMESFDIVVFHKGSEVATVLQGKVGPPDVAQAEQFVNAAVAKLSAG